MDLSTLKYAKGSRKKQKRVGRGEGSGQGVMAGRGHKGYGSRSGSKKRAWFEGGQMPLQRRLPKFGFTNIHRKHYQIINVGLLEKLAKESEITKEILISSGLIRKKNLPVKLLGEGDITKKITVKVDAVSKTAKEKIEKAGGTVILS
ncbi:50S ribosomal protein L15 [Calditrichota bacterium]